jgi:hypothetical protein
MQQQYQQQYQQQQQFQQQQQQQQRLQLMMDSKLEYGTQMREMKERLYQEQKEKRMENEKSNNPQANNFFEVVGHNNVFLPDNCVISLQNLASKKKFKLVVANRNRKNEPFKVFYLH